MSRDTVPDPITADGDYMIDDDSRNNTTTLNVNGTFGGGTLSVGYRTSGGVFKPYTVGATLTADGQLTIDHGIGVDLMVNLAGSTTPSIVVEPHGFGY